MRLSALVLAVAVNAALAATAQAGSRVQSPVCDPSPEANRRLVLEFYALGLGERQPRTAFERYVSPDFVEHKPDIPGGTRDATVDFLDGLIRDLPEARWEIVRAAAQDDLVFVHARFSPGPGAGDYALADIFRVENCRIVEHWDVVGGPVEDAPNPYPRF